MLFLEHTIYQETLRKISTDGLRTTNQMIQYWFIIPDQSPDKDRFFLLLSQANFIISAWKHVLWELIRIVSRRRF